MQTLQITRSAPNRVKLLKLYKKEKKIKLRERYLALIFMHDFKSCVKVAELLQKSSRTIQTWVNMFNNGGIEALIPLSPSGRPSRLTREEKEQLKADVLTDPRSLGYDFSNWEGKNIAYHVKKKFGVKLGVRAAQKLLHSLDFSLQRPRYKFPKANAKKQKEFVIALKKSSTLLPQTP
jgi:transposase